MMKARLCPVLQHRHCLGFGSIWHGIDSKRAFLTAVTAKSPVLTVNDKKVLLEMDGLKPPQSNGRGRINTSLPDLCCSWLSRFPKRSCPDSFATLTGAQTMCERALKPCDRRFCLARISSTMTSCLRRYNDLEPLLCRHMLVASSDV